MTIAIHQPNYFPWLGFFVKIYQSDLFVFHDAVPISASGYTKRCKVLAEKNKTDQRWLTVPVCKFSEGTPKSEIVIDESTDWRRKHVNALTNAYVSAPHFTEMISVVTQAFEDAKDVTLLSQLNIHLILRLCELLRMAPEYKLSGDLAFREKGSAFNLKIVEHFDGTDYLSGKGATNYEDVQSFDQAGIKIFSSDTMRWLKTNPYDQGTESFVGGLSILDVLMHLGVDSTRRIIENIVADSV